MFTLTFTILALYVSVPLDVVRYIRQLQYCFRTKTSTCHAGPLGSGKEKSAPNKMRIYVVTFFSSLQHMTQFLLNRWALGCRLSHHEVLLLRLLSQYVNLFDFSFFSPFQNFQNNFSFNQSNILGQINSAFIVAFASYTIA